MSFQLFPYLKKCFNPSQQKHLTYVCGNMTRKKDGRQMLTLSYNAIMKAILFNLLKVNAHPAQQVHSIECVCSELRAVFSLSQMALSPTTVI